MTFIKALLIVTFLDLWGATDPLAPPPPPTGTAWLKTPRISIWYNSSFKQPGPKHSIGEIKGGGGGGFVYPKKSLLF